MGAYRMLCLSGERKKITIAETYKHCITIVLDNVSKDAGFHATCYRRLTDKSAWFQWRNIKNFVQQMYVDA